MQLYKNVVQMQQTLILGSANNGFRIALGGVCAYYRSVELSLIRSK